MMSRIASVFQSDHKALIAYITVGYPDIEATEKIAAVLAASGCDLIELGIPFSDPLADGTTIQKASFQALQQGVTPETCLEVASRLSAKIAAPLVFMTYYNPVFNFGLEAFCRRCADSGISGLIIPDLPPEEASEQLSKAYQNAEKFIDKKSKEANLSKQEKKTLELEVAKLKGMKEVADKVAKGKKLSPADEKSIEELDDKWRDLLEKSPSKHAKYIMDTMEEKFNKILEEKLKPFAEKLTIEDEEAEFAEVIKLLPGDNEKEKAEAFEDVKPALNKFIKENPEYAEKKGGLVNALYILMGKGTIKIIEDKVQESEEEKAEKVKIKKDKKAIPGGGSGKRQAKPGTVNGKKFSEMTEEERDKLSQKEIDQMFKDQDNDQHV